MGKKDDIYINPWDLAKQTQIIKKVFDPDAPIVRQEQVIVVSVRKGDGSSETPYSTTDFYYKKDGTLIGEEK